MHQGIQSPDSSFRMSQPILVPEIFRSEVNEDMEKDPYQNYRFRRKPFISKESEISKTGEEFNEEQSLEGLNLVPWLSNYPTGSPGSNRHLSLDKHLKSWQKNLIKN